MRCISDPAYNCAMRMCATHGAEVMNCGPYCSQYDAPDTEGPDAPVNGGDAPPDDAMPPREMVNHAALDGLIARDDDDPAPVIDGGIDDDPATPE